MLGLREKSLDAITKKLPKLPWETLGFYTHGWEWFEGAIRKHKKALAGVKTLISANADSAPWDLPVADVTKLLAHLPAVEAIDFELITDIPQLIADNPRLQRVTIRMPGYSATFEPKAKRLALEIHYPWADVRGHGTLVTALKPATVVVSTTKKSKLVDGRIKFANGQVLSLAPLETAAKNAELIFDPR